MAKKEKEFVPSPQSVNNRDILQRLNYLYQASVYLANAPGGTPPSSTSGNTETTPKEQDARRNFKNRRGGARRKGKGKKGGQDAARCITTKDLARSYVTTLKVVGMKTTVKMDPSVKRSICPKCNIVLVPGHTVRVRVKGSSTHGHRVTFSCLECGGSRTIPAPHSSVTSSPQDVIPAVIEEQSSRQNLPIPTDSPQQQQQRRSTKNQIVSRAAPFFIRDVGHIVYAGNVRVAEAKDGDDGIFVT